MPYIHVDLDNLEDDDLIEEIESRGYKVVDVAPESVQDQIYNLYLSFVTDSQEDMYKVLKRFLEDNTGKIIL